MGKQHSIHFVPGNAVIMNSSSIVYRALAEELKGNDELANR